MPFTRRVTTSQPYHITDVHTDTTLAPPHHHLHRVLPGVDAARRHDGNTHPLGDLLGYLVGGVLMMEAVMAPKAARAISG